MAREKKLDSLEIFAWISYQNAQKFNDTFYQYKFLYYFALGSRPKVQTNIVYYLQRVRMLASSMGKDEDAFLMDLYMASEYRIKGETDTSKFILLRAFSYAEKNYNKNPDKKNALNVLKIQNNLASFYSFIGNESESIDYYLKNLEILKTFNDDHQKFVNLFNISGSYLTLAHQEFELGQVVTGKRFMVLAKKYFKLAEDQMPKDLPDIDQGSFYYNYSSMLFADKDYKKAKEKLRLAEQFYVKALYKDKYCKCYNLMGEIESKLMDKEKAIIHFQDAIKIGTEYTNMSCLSSAKNNLGLMWIETNHILEAIKLLEENIIFQKENQQESGLQNTYHNLYYAYKKLGNTQKALVNYENYISERDSHYAYKMYNDIDRMEMKFSVNELKDNVRELELKNDLLKKQKELVQSKHKFQLLFFSFICILIIFTSGLFYLFLQNKKNKTTQEKVAMEHLLLRARLNPHFIFNSLNSIQSQFFEGKIEQANQFLTDFCSFMRYILDKTERTHHAINEELELTEMYVNLEQQKYPNRFDFIKEIDENVDVDLAQMPTFILQPIIENSIFHGILNKDIDGIIKLKMQLNSKKNRILVSVSDNGKGLINVGLKTNGDSKAIDILKKRLGKKGNYSIENIYNNLGEVEGTITRFSIPHIA